MDVPPCNLASHVPPSSILAPLGISVKGVTPEVTACPLCGRHAFEIYMDPIPKGSTRWMRCSKCEFGGDTIDLYARLNNIKEMKIAIQDAFSKGFGDISYAAISPQTIEDYLTTCQQHRQRLKTIWAALSGQLPQMHPSLVKKVQSEHLWNGWRMAAQGRIRRILGLGTRYQILDLFEDKRFLPKKGFTSNMVINYQDVPGRICAFNFIGDGQEMLKTYRADGEGGLGMLEAINPYETLIYATGNPRIALRFHNNWFMDSNDPMKLVLFNSRTNQTWKHISAKKVVFWDEQLNLELFQQARLLGLNVGNVALRPSSVCPSPVQSFNLSRTFDSVMAEIDKNYYPWPEALIRWSIDREDGLDDQRFQEAIAALRFDKVEREALIEASPGKYRARIEGFLKSAKANQSAVVNGREVIENESGWWALFPQSRELVSNITMKVDKEVIDESTGKVYWEGEIRFQDRGIPFIESVEAIERDSKKWLVDKAVKAGCSYPDIKPNWTKFLVSIAQQFSMPRKVRRDSNLGIDKNGRILFPYIFIDATYGFKTRELATPDPGMPGQDVTMPALYKVKDIVNHSVRPVWMALTAAYLCDMTAALHGRGPVGCLVPGVYASASRRAAVQFAKVMGLDRHLIREGKDKELKEITSKLGGFNYPGFVETESSGLMAEYPNDSRSRVFLGVSRLEAAALAVSRHRWVTIESNEAIAQSCRLPEADSILLALQKVQRDGFVIPSGLPPVLATAKVLCSWYDEVRGPLVPSRWDEVSAVLKESPPPGDALVELCVWLYSQKMIRREHVAFVPGLKQGGLISGGVYAVLIDDQADVVFIDREVLVKLLRRQGLPAIDCDAVSDDFLERGLLPFKDVPMEGWIVPRGYWGERVKESWAKIPRVIPSAENRS